MIQQDPVMKVKYEELKKTYEMLQDRLRSLENEMWDIGIQIGTMAQQMKETSQKPRTFNDQIQSARLATKKRGMGMTGIAPHPLDKPSILDTPGTDT